MYLDRLFKLMADKQASDLYISCGAPINIKVNGVVHPVSSQSMDVETVRRIAYDLMTKEQAREFENEREMNLSHLDKAVGNFRINIFRQRGSIALVIRYVRNNVPPFEALRESAFWLLCASMASRPFTADLLHPYAICLDCSQPDIRS